MLQTSYRNYFRNLAIRHKEILHDPASEEEGAPATNRHFIQFNTDDVVNALSTAFGAGPCLALHDYEWNVKDNGAYAFAHEYKGSLLVIKKAIANDPVDTAAVKDLTETIMADVQAQMRVDQYNIAGSDGSPFKDIDWNKARTIPVGPMWDNCYGWYLEFSFSMHVGSLEDDAARAAEAFNADPTISYGESAGDGIHLGDGVKLVFTNPE